MKKIAIVFWSGTGNTQAMAEAAAEGAKAAGAEVSVLGPSDFGPSDVSSYDAIGFGCPSMGSEVLEEMEFEPMFASVEGSLSGKAIALFGSWGWGEGAWMEDWKARCEADGAILVCDPVICQEAPDDSAIEACKELGAKLAG